MLDVTFFSSLLSFTTKGQVGPRRVCYQLGLGLSCFFFFCFFLTVTVLNFVSGVKFDKLNHYGLKAILNSKMLCVKLN